MTIAPPVRRYLVGSALRRYRENLGLTLEDSARAMECDKSKISRIETGQRGITPRELCELLTEYGVTDPAAAALAALTGRRGCWPQYRIPESLRDLLALELAATGIWIWIPHQVPALLQTCRYAHALIAADPAIPADDRDQHAELTLARQHVILGQHKPAITVVISEAALRPGTATRDIIREQAQYLAGLQDATIRVLPDAAITQARGSGPVTIFWFAGTSAVMHVASLSGGAFLTSDSDINDCTAAFTRLREAALTHEATARLLQDISRA